MGLFGSRNTAPQGLYDSGKNVQVVGGAIFDLTSGKMFAARRNYPLTLAGGWELPGGKLERGESHEDALRRELEEELKIRVQVGPRVPGEWRLNEHAKMRVYTAVILSGTPTLQRRGHDQMRWLAPSQWNDVRWLINDQQPVKRSMAALKDAIKRGSL